METQRKIQQKPRAVRKLLEFHNCDSIQNDDSPKNVSKFKFPPPPKLLPVNSPSKSCSPLWQSISDMETTSDSQSDTGIRETSSPIPMQNNNTVYKMRGYQSDGSPTTSVSRCLPPIGVFWDIENCQIPRGRSAVTVAQTIRDRFFDGYREVEFLVVCDVKKETAQVVKELNDAQVNLIHVGATSKNAADEKLRQSIRRFADIHGSPSAVILISGDINFAPDLCDLRHRKKVHVILIHNEKCSESLILCANEHHNFSNLVSNLPYRINAKTWNQPSEVHISNLPAGQDHGRIRHRLKRLAENCGGRVGFITDSTTTIRFPSLEAATRAQKRMDGEKVFGSTIIVGNPVEAGDLKLGSPLKMNYNSSFSGKMDNEIQNSPQYFNNPQAAYIPPASMIMSQNITGTVMSQNWHKITHNGNSYPQLQGLGDTGGQVLARSTSMVNTHPLTHMSEQVQQPFWNPSWNMPYQNGVLKPKGRPILGARDTDNNFKEINQNVNGMSTKKVPLVGMAILKRTRAESPPSEIFIGKQKSILHNNSQGEAISPRKCRTPSPYTLLGVNTSIPPPPIINVPRRNDYMNGEKTNINNVLVQPASLTTSKPVELRVTNLDQNLNPLELKKILMSTFKDFVMVLHVGVYVQTNGYLTASVKVPSIQAAQTAITQLQKHKVDLNHIKLCYADADMQAVRSHIVNILSQVPGFRLPLLEFCKQYESRYGSAVNIPSLYNMQDTFIISEEACELFITLTIQQQKESIPVKDICQGCLRKAVPEEQSPLPKVKIELSLFSKCLQDLVLSHNSSLPLSSLVECFKAEHGRLEVDDLGVPLEHLVTWVPRVELSTDTQGVKHICIVQIPKEQIPKEGSEEGSKENINPPVPTTLGQLSAFSREVIELLRLQPQSRLMFNQFIPLYHQHFGRQCRVADYGFTRLVDLLEAIPKTVQVIGEGNDRMLLPTRLVQLRQLNSDIMRILRSQSSKQFVASTFDALYERTFRRTFDPVYYGLCYLEDLLKQLKDDSIVVTGSGPSCIVAIAKREQTKEEMERTQKFALEVIELLSKEPDYKISLQNFIPSYNRHFKYQCRLSDYGFTKLLQLFDAIPHIVKLDEVEKLWHISLINEKKLKVLCSQILSLLSQRESPSMQAASISSAFCCKFGYDLVPTNYGCKDLNDLLGKLHPVIEVTNVEGVTTLIYRDHLQIQQLSLRVCRILMEHPNGKMLLVDFQKQFQILFQENCALDTLEKDLEATVKVSRDRLGEVTVQLTSLQLFARDVYRLLSMSEGRLALSSFEAMYFRILGTAVQPAQYGYKTVIELLEAIPHTVLIREKGNKQILILNKEMQSAGIVLPSSFSKASPNQDSIKCSRKTLAEDIQQEHRQINQSQLYFVKEILENTDKESQKINPMPDLTLQCNAISKLPTYSVPHIVPPDPSELPLPQLLTNKQDQQPTEIESSAEVCKLAVDLLQSSPSSLEVIESNSYLINNKRKMRLAAQFQTPIQLI